MAGLAPTPLSFDKRMIMESLTPTDYIGLAWCYLVFAVPVHIALVGCGAVVSLPALAFGRTRFLWLVRSLATFFIALLITGFVLNTVWNIVVFNRYYWQYDYAAWECSPFGLLIYEEPHNPACFFQGTHEKTIRNLHEIYVLLTWTSAYILSLLVNRKLDGRRRMSNQVPEDTTRKLADPQH